MKRIQFSLTWLAIAALVIGAFFGGVTTGRRCYEIENERQLQVIKDEKAAVLALQKINRPTSRFGLIRHQKVPGEVYGEVISLPDGSEWDRTWRRISPDDGVRIRQFQFDEP